MNENSAPTAPSAPQAPRSSAEDLTRAVARLQTQLQAALVLMIMVTGALNLYLLRQYVALRKDVQRLEPQVGQMMDIYNKATVPLARVFLGHLADYARQHPDFQPILDRYRVQVGPGTGAPPAGTQAPAQGGTNPAPPRP